MSSSTGQQLGGQDPDRDFEHAVASCTIKTATEAGGRPYVRPSRLYEWWQGETTFNEQPTTQATRLLHHVYRNWSAHSHSVTMTRDTLFGNNPCIIIFSILLEIGWGDLIHRFRNFEKFDKSLPFRKSDLESYIREMATRPHRLRRRIPNPDDVSAKFFEAQWKFCPVKFTGEEQDISSHSIIPIHRKELITEKGGTAKLFQIEVLSEFVVGNLREAAENFKYLPIDNPDGQGSVSYERKSLFRL